MSYVGAWIIGYFDPKHDLKLIKLIKMINFRSFMVIWWSFIDIYVTYFKNHAPKYYIKGHIFNMFEMHIKHSLHFGREVWVFGAELLHQKLLGVDGASKMACLRWSVLERFF